MACFTSLNVYGGPCWPYQKKLMSLMLGLSFALRTVAVFADAAARNRSHAFVANGNEAAPRNRDPPARGGKSTPYIGLEQGVRQVLIAARTFSNSESEHANRQNLMAERPQRQPSAAVGPSPANSANSVTPAMCRPCGCCCLIPAARPRPAPRSGFPAGRFSISVQLLSRPRSRDVSSDLKGRRRRGTVPRDLVGCLV